MAFSAALCRGLIENDGAMRATSRLTVPVVWETGQIEPACIA